MDASICVYSNNEATTEVEIDLQDSGSSIFFRDESILSNYVRIFLSIAQMRTLRDQLDQELSKLPVPEPEPAEASQA